MQWRSEFQVEDIYKTFVYSEGPKVAAIYPRYYHKNDNEGRPIYVEHFDKLNYTAMFKVTTEKRFMQNHVLEFEKFLRQRLLAVSWKSGRHIEQSCTILDLKNVALSQFPQVRSVVGTISEISQDYYPETLGKMFVINAPRFFTTVWAVVKMFLDEVTVAKIHILGSDYRDTLLQNIPAANLPKEFGGECECDGGCRMSDVGVWTDVESDWEAARKFEEDELKRLWEIQLKKDEQEGHSHDPLSQSQKGLQNSHSHANNAADHAH
ncbi:cytosolic factor, phosphatidylinositol/phosphatidylcholine transfer protein [Gonapodya sp. JEL0774]|nr:cytosolic factor, phosphatidylinositol/phosphatidylcholine transfer protein [Gonapodya sp. JEL0774]